MAGAGVLEGWSHYIWHYVTREIPQLTPEVVGTGKAQPSVDPVEIAFDERR